jgi:hypothetical protein
VPAFEESPPIRATVLDPSPLIVKQTLLSSFHADTVLVTQSKRQNGVVPLTEALEDALRHVQDVTPVRGP